jgi:V/A-type H+-transporting ATPase subunit C
MPNLTNQPVINFHRYPSIGEEDWRYAYSAAHVRSLEVNMLGRSVLTDMANAPDYKEALDMLSSTEYALTVSGDLEELEKNLIDIRTGVRDLFHELMVDEDLANLLRVREDFGNMRLALRRKLTDRSLGVDYCNDGSIPAEQFEITFEQEDYSPLPYHMQLAIERAVLAYYQEKDIRQIDIALDGTLYEYLIETAIQLRNTFLLEMFRMNIDLINIRTMLRLKFNDTEQRNVFLDYGYIGINTLKHSIDMDYDSISSVFSATPYNDVVEAGTSYLASNKSFLMLDHKIDAHIQGYLKCTRAITAGPQPIIAYLLLKESEIRLIRLILTAKNNKLDTRLILDRIGG